MQIRLIVVGKTADPTMQLLIVDYISRLKHYCNFKIDLVQPKGKKKASNESELKKSEAEVILKSLNENSVLILLDEKGKQYSSENFAYFLQKHMNAAPKDLVFCIGGAYGFDDSIYSRSQAKLALSEMTFTHQMVRLIYVEQLYRAFTILKGENYHH
jgi:23S rRNA (pseudouridine1915-N3)-methyltransferase